MGKLILGIGVNDKHPTYKDCTVSEMFKHFHLFHAWCQEQVGFRALGYCLDKDLLLKGNKHYVYFYLW